MKKLLKYILIVTLVLGGLFLHVEEDHDHIHTVEALTAGDVYGSCPNCGGTAYIEEVISEPTCTSAGSITIFCVACGMENYPVSIAATGHNYQKSSAAGTPANCTNGGTDFYVCANCGDSYTQNTPALGHDYSAKETEAATCTQSGMTIYTCSRCNHTYSETVSALGHNYLKKVTKKATCEEDGTETYTCSRCSDSYTRTIKASGHDYEYKETEPSCTEEGHREGVCKNCGEKTEEILPALGHDFKETAVTKEPTCTEDGTEEVVCERCGEKEIKVLGKKGHVFPEEWTIEKEAGLFSKGLQSKICGDCGEKLTEEITPKVTPPVLLGGAGVLAAAGAGLYFLLKKGKKVQKTAAVEEVTEEGFKPEFETKTIVTDTEDEELLKMLKDQVYLEVTGVSKEELDASVEESGPHLVISDPKTEEELDDLLKRKKEKFPDTALGLVLSKELVQKKKSDLDSLKEDGEITGYVLSGAHYTVLTKLVLPILKPEISSDETLDNIGMIADALGIPLVSSLINVYISGRDIKATLEDSEKIGISESATIIGDIASILGLDAVAGAAGLVDDIDAVKASLDKEAGAYEKKEGIAAAKDAVEVIGGLLDR